jgi:hypothetical protein
VIAQQVGHWQLGVVLAGSAHWKLPTQDPRQAQVGEAEQAAGTVTQWNVGPSRTSSLTQARPAAVQTSHEATSEHWATGRQPPA